MPQRGVVLALILGVDLGIPAGQVGSLFGAGFDAACASLPFLLYALALKPSPLLGLFDGRQLLFGVGSCSLFLKTGSTTLDTAPKSLLAAGRNVGFTTIGLLVGDSFSVICALGNMCLVAHDVLRINAPALKVGLALAIDIVCGSTKGCDLPGPNLFFCLAQIRVRQDGPNERRAKASAEKLPGCSSLIASERHVCRKTPTRRVESLDKGFALCDLFPGNDLPFSAFVPRYFEGWKSWSTARTMDFFLVLGIGKPSIVPESSLTIFKVTNPLPV
jgi:hypothetical protein